VLQHEIPPPQLLAWNASQPMLAIGHSSSGAVLLYNCASAATAGSSAPGSIQRPQHVLVHQLQQQVSSVAWRPVHSSMLAVGCAGGVAMWNLGKLPLSTAAMSRGSDGATNAAAAWTTFLSFRANCRCGVPETCTAQAAARMALSRQQQSLPALFSACQQLQKLHVAFHRTCAQVCWFSTIVLTHERQAAVLRVTRAAHSAHIRVMSAPAAAVSLSCYSIMRQLLLLSSSVAMPCLCCRPVLLLLLVVQGVVFGLEP
jgi:hypothetical protein